MRRLLFRVSMHVLTNYYVHRPALLGCIHTYASGSTLVRTLGLYSPRPATGFNDRSYLKRRNVPAILCTQLFCSTRVFFVLDPIF